MKILLVGCGNMGAALIEGWLKAKIIAPEDMHVVARSLPLKNLGSYTLQNPPQIYLASDIAVDISDLEMIEFDFIVFAVRPQTMAMILPIYQKLASKKTPFITVAAGLEEVFYRGFLGDETPIIRVMPNMPTAIGQGMNGIYYNDYVRSEVKIKIQKLMQVLGEIEILKNETDMGAFTALAGSGPAYLYLLVEAMSKAAIKLGLDSNNTEKIALQTVLGAAQYLQANGSGAENLRFEVALPGGTTEQALNVFLRNDAMFHLVEAAMQAACDRSKIMGEELAVKNEIN